MIVRHFWCITHGSWDTWVTLRRGNLSNLKMAAQSSFLKSFWKLNQVHPEIHQMTLTAGVYLMPPSKRNDRVYLCKIGKQRGGQRQFYGSCYSVTSPPEQMFNITAGLELEPLNYHDSCRVIWPRNMYMYVPFSSNPDVSGFPSQSERTSSKHALYLC